MPTDRVSLELDSSGLDRTLRSMNNFSSQQIGLGSSASDTHFLRFMGSFLGTDPAGLARGAYQKSLSGMGLLANLRAGNPVQFDELQPVDYGQRLIKLIQELVDINRKNGYDAARLFARQAEIEPALRILQLSDRSRRRMMDMMNERADPMSGFSRSQAEFDAARDRLSFTFQKQIAPAASAILDIITAIFTPVGSNFKIQGNQLVPVGGGSGGGGSMNANTQALNDLTNELRHTKGIFGGGKRARRAIPGAFGPGWGGFLPDALRSETVRLGAYAVNM